jgi:hypothetical protein
VASSVQHSGEEGSAVVEIVNTFDEQMAVAVVVLG